LRIAIPRGHLAPQNAALAGLAAGLERVRASTIAREGAWVLFYVRFFRLVWNTNLLCPIDSGAINAEVDGDAIKVSYRLRTIRLCIMTTGMALGAVAVTLSGSLDFMKAGGIGLLAWLWLFGGNYLIALVRFRWFVKGCVREGFAGSIRTPRGVTVTS
jgi:hypothetical protein